MSAPTNPIAEFRRVPPGFWKSRENRHAFLDWLGHQSGYRRPEDWYRLKIRDLDHRGAGALVEWCGFSLRRLLEDYRPEHDWKDWLFARVPRGFWSRRENQVAYLDWVGEQLGYKEPEDWYQVETSVLYELGAESLLKKLGGTNYRLMRIYMPDYDWKPWLFREVPAGFWKVRENRVEYLEWLGRELGFEKPEDWYRLSIRDLSRNGGTILAHRFRNVAGVVKSHFPDYEWLHWRFDVDLVYFWEDDDHCRRYLEWLGGKLGFAEPDDWYALTKAQVMKNHGSALYAKFGSVRAIARFLHPDHEWLEWRFPATPHGFWFDRECRRRYLDWLGGVLGFKSWEDWYGLTQEDLSENHGSTLSRIYGGRIYLIMTENYPEHDWLEWRFSKTSDDFWGKRENCQRYLDWLAGRLGFKTLEDWYQVNTRSFYENYGYGVLTKFRGSYVTLLKTCHPDYEWKEWFFDRVSADFWADEANRRRYLDWLGRELGYRRTQDWYQLTRKQMISRRGERLLRMFGNVPGLLREYRPDFDWKEWLFPTLPPGFWKNPETRRRYLVWLGAELGFKSPRDWCRLEPVHFLRSRGKKLLQMYFTVDAILRSAFPANHPVVRARGIRN